MEKKDDGDINWFYYSYVYDPNIEHSSYLNSGYLNGEYITGYEDSVYIEGSEYERLQKYMYDCAKKLNITIYNSLNVAVLIAVVEESL